MMGGFYIRFGTLLTKEEFQKLINNAKLRVVDISDGSAHILLVGRHWWSAVRVFPFDAKEYEYIYLCENEENENCMKELEEDLQSKWLFPANECHNISAKIEQDNYNPYRFDIEWICYEVRRYAILNVEINTNYIDQHDVDVLKIVAKRVAEMNVRDVVRPM